MADDGSIPADVVEDGEEETGEEAPQVEEAAVETPLKGEEPPSEDRERVMKAFSELPGIGPATAQALWEAGFTSKAKLRGASEEELAKIKGLGPASVKKIQTHLKESSG